VINGFERPQTELLEQAIRPHLDQHVHTDAQYWIGGDVAFYWNITNPPVDGCKCPDFAYVPGVPGMLDGEYRRSYVMWQEHVRPLLLIEFISNDSGEEYDTTPNSGKFWVYEQALQAKYYLIHDPDHGRLEAFELVQGHYQQLSPNSRGHFPIPEIGVELGVWQGEFRSVAAPFVRFFDFRGRLLPISKETEAKQVQQIETERKRFRNEKRRADEVSRQLEEATRQAEEEKRRADKEKQNADILREKLRQLGIDPDQVGSEG
jgi:Uma2 family endonuclease